MRKHIEDRGLVGTVVGVGIGGAAFFAAVKAAQSITWLQGKWWATPILLVVVGHVMKRWSHSAGQAVVGAAGALLAYSYYVQNNIAPAPSATTTTPAAGVYSQAGAVQRRLLPRGAGVPARGVYSEAGALVT